MLFDPESTFESVGENLDFLERICGDGYSPISFCKMLPYAETEIEYKLKDEGRLKGTPGFWDYEFRQPSLNDYYYFVTNCFGDWITKHNGLLNIAKWSRYYTAVQSKYFPNTIDSTNIDNEVTSCISESNLFLISALRTLAGIFINHSYYELDFKRLNQIKENIAETHLRYKSRLTEALNKMDGNVAIRWAIKDEAI